MYGELGRSGKAVPGAVEEECAEACRLACADEFIERFPDGYNTWIEQGGNNVSGGQKQRLCIARALLKNPKVLILDDSTSAVDTATDARIREAFAKKIPGTTKLIVAQRISSVQEADRILVLDNGRVNGFDTHENLLRTNPIYREIYEAQTPDYTALAGALLSVGATYGLGILCAYSYNRIMVNVSQGTMRNLRIELFRHMESLPIRYFDTHAHGDIMSVYTNDVDTLRQLMSQSIPQVINSSVTILTSFVSMLVLDVPLTLITLAAIGVMLFVTSRIAAKSSMYFARQQKDLGIVNGYIEEMMEGQKVVKVFCHEEKSLEQFRILNNQLRESADKANTFSNISMPINANLGNVSYVLCAVTGAIFALNGYLGLTLGTLVSFLTLNKNSTQPVSQISQQLNSIVMAMAGARRIFDLMDEEPEEDDGYVTLVNVREESDGTLTETQERTNLWAWKHPHKADGTVTYQKLEGDITFDDVGLRL